MSTADPAPAPSSHAPSPPSSATPSADDGARVRAEAAAYSADRRTERRRASWPSMLLSLAVVFGVVVVLLLLVPRVNSVTQPPVNVTFGARAAAEQVEFTPAVPTGLPQGWRPTSVRTTRSTAEVMTWHAGFQTPSSQYAAVEQGQDAPTEWVRAQVNRALETGTQDVEGQTWRRFVRQDKLQNSLVHQQGAVTTIVTGTAGFDELGVLAASLEPAG